MNKTRGSIWALMAAVAAVPLLTAVPAQAQFPVGQNGHANDANQRVGGSGYNSGGGGGGPAVTGNQIVNGNVTRGAEFRGRTAGDARAFSGRVPGADIDRFVSDSSGAATRAQPNLNSFSPQPFYGNARAVPPPSGYVPLAGGAGYVQPSQAPYNFNLAAAGGPAVLSTYGSNFTGDTPNQQLGTTVVLGPTDEENRQNLLLLSPLSGIQQVQLNDVVGLNGYPVSRTLNYVRQNPSDRLRASDRTIEQMRRELDEANPNAQNTAGQTAGGQGTNEQPNQATSPPGTLNNAMQQPFDSPANQPLQNGQFTSPLQQQVLPAQLQTGQSVGPRLATPAQQSVQYNELQQRLQRYESQRQPGTAQNAQSQQESAAKAAAQGLNGVPATPPGPAPTGVIAPGATAPGGAIPGVPIPGARTPRPLQPVMPAGSGAGQRIPPTTVPPPATRIPQATPQPGATLRPAGHPVPVLITSLATGISSPTLKGTLKSAEDLMKKGKFASALDQYDLAEQAAPNNPLIALGKANAELGASSYRSADAHIRQAFGTDRALLLARFDLKGFIGAERLQLIENDLKELAKANPQEPMAPFLLGYIAYNNGNAPQAQQYLIEAEKREGKPDPIIGELRQFWTLPATATPTPRNK